jgi:cysteinyl-tRNA synthetase
MNITDVDDKIILKARRNHLLKQFFASPPPASDVLDRVRHGILSATTKLQVRCCCCCCSRRLSSSPPACQSKLEKLTDEKARAAAAAAAGSKSASKQARA